MTQEITTVSLASFTHAYLIQPVIIAALSEQPGFAVRNCREFNLVGQGTTAAQLPIESAYWGTPNDRGAGVATAFNTSQANAIGNTPYTAGAITCTPGEYGVAHSLVDNVVEDSVDGLDLMNLFSGRMLRVLQLAIDDDYIALFPAATFSVGTTNVAVTVAQMISAQQGLRTRGVVADSVAYTLGNTTSNYLESALQATSTNIAVYALSTDRLINYAPTVDNGMNTTRQVMTFRGIPAYTTGLTDTANAGVDEVSACTCPTSKANDDSGATSHAIAWKRMPRFETQRFAKLRATDLVMTCRAGLAKLQDGATTSIITKGT
jgi:hypothetical protein